MKTIPSVLTAVLALVPVALFAAGVAPAAASEPAKSSTEQHSEQTAKQTADVDAANGAAKDAAGKQAPVQDAGKHDSRDASKAAAQDDTVMGGKVPSPADVAKSSAGKGTPQRFTPSEQVRPDFDVSFPIDI